MSLKDKIDLNKLPTHIAIIMDGNGRWAKQKGKIRVFGHQHGVKSVRDAAESCAELGVKYLTLYAFSTENWNRPKLEINALMELLVSTINKETKTLNDNDIKLEAIGDLKSLPSSCYRELMNAIEKTKNNKRMTLVLALSYSSRMELVEAMKSIAKDVAAGKINADEIDENTIIQNIYTKDIPDPELLIRTSGEHRISNFLLWQSAYTELYFTDTLWPDFGKEKLYEAIIDFQSRERRFGMTSEQMKK
ncbi:MAG: isoprenyl transferase [Bacteroidota bacterium]